MLTQPSAQSDPAWWREAVVYQIYPRSFQDSDGDGVGDLDGIAARLDYLARTDELGLGVDAIWLSPVYPSPQADLGYDVSDYLDVDSAYGGLAALDRLVAAAHRRGIRVLLDFVANHTSRTHPWFVESRSSRVSSRRDWYYWRRPGPGGGPPNNWCSVFGGPAWTLDPATGQYYLHSYLPEQPDLNWRNPAVVAALGDAMRFWLRRGIDGFRLDAIGRIAKHPGLADNPPNPRFGSHPGEPRLRDDHNYLHRDGADMARAIRRVLDEFPARVAIGEAYAPVARLAPLYGPPALDGLHMMFDFRLIRAGPSGALTGWRAEEIAAALEEAERDLPAGTQVCWALGNHDVPRLVSRHDADGRGGARARAAALLLLALRGTPCLYAGDEIGMVEGAIPPVHRVDPVGRDGARTPMQWDRSQGRGFTGGIPWLPFGPPAIDVASQSADPGSLLALYRRALRVRRQEPPLRRGSLRELAASEGIVSFVRAHPGSRPVLIALNDRPEARHLPVPAAYSSILLASQPGTVLEGDARARALTLPPLAAAWLAPGPSPANVRIAPVDAAGDG